MSSSLKGYTLDDIDSSATDLIQSICELGIPPDLAFIALCRAIVMLGSTDDLDVACRIIDELSDVPFERLEFDGEN